MSDDVFPCKLTGTRTCFHLRYFICRVVSEREARQIVKEGHCKNMSCPGALRGVVLALFPFPCSDGTTVNQGRHGHMM